MGITGAPRKYGCNVCGEGGEYETLVLDCPLFTRARIVLDAWEARALSAGGPGAVAALHPTRFRLEPKQAPGARSPDGAGPRQHGGDSTPDGRCMPPGCSSSAGAVGQPGPPPPAAGCSGAGGGAGPPANVAMMPDDWQAAPAAAGQPAQGQPGAPGLHHAAHVSLQVSSSGAHASCAPRLAAGAQQQQQQQALPPEQRVAHGLHAALRAIQQGATRAAAPAGHKHCAHSRLLSEASCQLVHKALATSCMWCGKPSQGASGAQQSREVMSA